MKIAIKVLILAVMITAIAYRLFNENENARKEYNNPRAYIITRIVTMWTTIIGAMVGVAAVVAAVILF